MHLHFLAVRIAVEVARPGLLRHPASAALQNFGRGDTGGLCGAQTIGEQQLHDPVPTTLS